MAKRQSAWAKYESKLAEADRLAKQAARELRDEAKALVGELEEVAAAYEELTEQKLPELARLAGGSRGSKTSRPAPSSGRKPGGSAPRGRRTKLSGAYAGLTIPDAIHKAIGKSKKGIGPSEIAKKIGGNPNSVAVALSAMVKDREIKKAGRARYVQA